jgi:hypothetical protein
MTTTVSSAQQEQEDLEFLIHEAEASSWIDTFSALDSKVKTLEQRKRVIIAIVAVSITHHIIYTCSLYTCRHFSRHF